MLHEEGDLILRWLRFRGTRKRDSPAIPERGSFYRKRGEVQALSEKRLVILRGKEKVAGRTIAEFWARGPQEKKWGKRRRRDRRRIGGN